jgi:hypothetical protein
VKPIYLKLCGTLSKYINKHVTLDRYYVSPYYGSPYFITKYDISNSSYKQLKHKFDDELFDVTYNNINNAIKKELLKTIHR